MSFLEYKTLRCPAGSNVSVLSEQLDYWQDTFERRTIIYRKDGNIFFTEDFGGFGEDIGEIGKPIKKDQLLVRYQPTMLQCTDYETSECYLKWPSFGMFDGESTVVRDSFAQELSIYERLRQHPHPGICKYKGCMVVDGYVEAFALEWYKCDLAEAITEALPIDTATVFNRVKDAVAHLHSLGLVHNDLSPYNILLDGDLNPVVADFETCMPEGHPRLLKYGTPDWSDNWECSALENDKIALERIRLYLKGEYRPPMVR